MTQHEDEGRPTWGRAGERPGAPRAEDQLSEQGVRPRPTAATTARAVSSWVDQQIQQAQRQGAFDDLPGAGRPLRDVDTRTDPDWWVRGLVEREQLDLSEALPGAMQLRREKAGFPDSLMDLPDEAAVRARLEDFNERVLADRRRPHVGTTSPPVVGRVDVDALVGVWRAAHPASRSPEGSVGEVAGGVTGDVTAEQGGAAGDPRRRSWWGRTWRGPTWRRRMWPDRTWLDRPLA
ncbi:DUF1992 domain-containing protein [Ornithinimicrobium cerasi]|uniref:DnaJ homologue subfamily C member 28 conserved domain-containing protein n=1 Tax=Ornithinimicrobium cerasi TaxID=2248773 RepID=A0A285VB36_9MICO|nr:DUF1992 domain-containing protein [Ornithinimicrobium cerasi]SOC51304.1 protein of unknown function [Ornithinimicrobium cerasi]